MKLTNIVTQHVPDEEDDFLGLALDFDLDLLADFVVSASSTFASEDASKSESSSSVDSLSFCLSDFARDKLSNVSLVGSYFWRQ